MDTTDDRVLRAAIREAGLLSDVQLKVVDDYHRSVGGTLADVIVRLGFAGEDQLKAVAGRKKGIRVDETMVARDLADRIPRKLLKGYRVMPVVHNGCKVLAAETDLEPIVREELSELLGVQLDVLRAAEGSVAATLDAAVVDDAPSPAPVQDAAPSCASGAASGGKLPVLSVKELLVLLLRKGVITEEEIRAVAGRGRRQAAASPR